MLKSLRRKFNLFLNEDKAYPILTIIAPCVYALMYYYDKNYAFINSKSQFLFLLALYIFTPLVAYYVIDFIFKTFLPKNKWRKYSLSVINLSCFCVFMVISTYGFQKVKMLFALCLGIGLGILLIKHIKKIVVLQILLWCLVLPMLIPDIYREVVYSKKWMEQPDDIETSVFKKQPNIYVIQPDGYANFSSFKNSLYNYDNTEFKGFLETKGFKTYDNFRSNYFSTLSSNSSMFSMKHHYYGNTTLGISTSHNARNAIVENNPVLRTLKYNGYKTFLMLQVPYLLANRPTIDFDYCNMSLDELSYLSKGFGKHKNLLKDTKAAIKANKSSRNFFFIESMLPSHIVTFYDPSSSAEKEREKYLDRIELANQELREFILFIEEEDPNGIIIIAADHGGYVGLNASSESQVKVDDPLIINSMFASALAIKWPNSEFPKFDNQLNTSVNLFRVLFSFLSNNKSYLDNLQDDKSYIIIRDGAPTGVYEYINEEGETVFKKIE